MQELSQWGKNSAVRFNSRESYWRRKQQTNFEHTKSFQGKIKPEGYREFIEHKHEIAIVGDSMVV